MTIAKSICGLIAAILFALKTFGVPLGNLDEVAAGLFFLTLAIAPISL